MEVNTLQTAQERFEAKLLIAAEQALQAGFIQTYRSLLDVYRVSRHGNETPPVGLSRALNELAEEGVEERRTPALTKL